MMFLYFFFNDLITLEGISPSLRKPGQSPILPVDLPLALLCRLQQVCHQIEENVNN